MMTRRERQLVYQSLPKESQILYASRVGSRLASRPIVTGIALIALIPVVGYSFIAASFSFEQLTTTIIVSGIAMVLTLSAAMLIRAPRICNNGWRSDFENRAKRGFRSVSSVSFCVEEMNTDEASRHRQRILQ